MKSFGRDSMAPGGNPLGEVLAHLDFGEEVPGVIRRWAGEWTVKGNVLTKSDRSDDVNVASVHIGGDTNYRVQARVRMLDMSPGATAGIGARILEHPE